LSQSLLVYRVPHLQHRVSCSYARVGPLPPVTHVTSCGYRACRCRDTMSPLRLLNRLKKLLWDLHPFPQSSCVFLDNYEAAIQLPHQFSDTSIN
jgi:hypothetical protein